MHAVKWNTVCLSKANGGLGIGRVAVKNKALLAKWAWRFGNEKDSLWKKVIIAGYGLKESDIFWRGSNKRSASHFARAVASIFSQGSKSASIMKEKLRAVIGMWDSVNFWDILCGGSNTLRESFP